MIIIKVFIMIANAALIFVTNVNNIISGEKIVMWRKIEPKSTFVEEK